MAVDYGTKAKPTPTVDGPIVPSASYPAAVKPTITVEQVFLALLTAHTTAAGGSKYWGVTKNVPGNVSRLKSLAQQIVEAY